MKAHLSRKRAATILVVVVLIVAVTLSLFFYLNSQKPYAGPVESITVGLLPNELNSLIYVADTQQYFSSNGLNVTIKNYSSILTAVTGVLSGDLDISTASEFVLVGNALTNQNISTIATIDKVTQVSIICRKDKGIENTSDLAGKRIGVFKGSVSEFYLGRFLELNRISLSQVTMIDTSSNVIDALTNGTVDAVITGQPNINRIENIFGNGIVEFPAQGLQATYYGALCANGWATAHPELVTRFLNSLIKAEQYINNNPAQAKIAIQSRLNYSDQYMAEVWSDHQFSLSLDQSLVVAMENEARWLINDNLTNATAVPNFLDYIYLDGLVSVKPESVNIIH
jgi:ABC-type nitrate/sulfonate/bicarbonate transport system substrate-binding protein